MDHNFKYVFGPVPSRRLGRSLGVDLVPFKTCTYDCIYCQLGRTTCKTTERREYVPVADVLAELKARLAVSTPPDYITLSGSGEPTLHSGIGEIIAGIRKLTQIPIAVLTNGSLLINQAVQQELGSADLIIPSLDAGDDVIFQRINRPHADIRFEAIVSGLAQFCTSYRGEVWLEVFLLGGITDIDAEVAKIARQVKCICLTRVQLNTVARPPAEDYAHPVPLKQMERYCGFFFPQAEVIVEHDAFPETLTAGGAESKDIIALLGRRPCTLKDIADGLGLHPTQVAKTLEHLRNDGKIIEQRVDNRIYYEPLKQKPAIAKSERAPAGHGNRVKDKIKDSQGT